MNKKISILILVVLILGILVLAGFLLRKEEEKEPEIVLFPTHTEEKEDFYQSFDVSFDAIEQLTLPQGFKEQFEPESESDIETTASIQEAPKVSKPRLSDEEYFSRVYPASFAGALNVYQNAMTDDGFMKESEKIEFKTEEDTFTIFTKFTEYSVFKEYISEERGNELKHGINVVLRELNIIERPIVEKRLLGINWGDFLGKIFSFFHQAVYAQGEVDIGAECYRTSPPGSSMPGVGYNTWAMCCNCGLYCSYGCIYVQNCGPAGVYCNVHYGCLNLVCSGRAAIWDPMGGICGCG